MSLEREIKDAFGELASDVRTGAPTLGPFIDRARRRIRDRRIAFASLAVAAVVATAVVVPELVGDERSGVIVQPGPQYTPRGIVTPTPTSIVSPTASPTGPGPTASPPAAAPTGLTISLSLPSGRDTAEIVEAEVRIRDDAGGVSEVLALWGETPGQFPQIAPACAAPVGPAPATDETRELRHSYRTPGTYTIRVKVWTGHCQNTAGESIETQGTITIGQGATPSNGPLAPTVHIEDRRHLDGPRASDDANFYLGGGDEDGYVRSVVVDYGDGTTAVLVDAPLTECEEPEGRWPSTYLVGQEVTHSYAPGTYTLTVTVISVGCDGLDEQRRKRSFEVMSPG